MTFDGHHVFLDEKFTQQPNHQRVARLLREMDCRAHTERRSTRVYKTPDRRSEPSVFAHWAQILRNALPSFN